MRSAGREEQEQAYLFFYYKNVINLITNLTPITGNRKSTLNPKLARFHHSKKELQAAKAFFCRKNQFSKKVYVDLSEVNKNRLNKENRLNDLENNQNV